MHDRRSTAIRAFRRQLRGVRAVDHVAGQPLPRRCQGQRHADQAAAQDDDISTFSGVCGGR